MMKWQTEVGECDEVLGFETRLWVAIQSSGFSERINYLRNLWVTVGSGVKFGLQR
jgi:hypothetical protein